MNLQQNRDPLPVSGCQRNLLSTKLEQCLLPNAGCCLLVSVEEGQNLSEAAIVASILQVEAALSGRKVDRRMFAADVGAELWLTTCAWSRNGQMARRSTPERSRARG